MDSLLQKEYDTVKRLFEFYPLIISELRKMIDMMIYLLHKFHTAKGKNEREVEVSICSVFFYDIVFELGQIGKDAITTLDELKAFVSECTIREAMTMIKNFQREQNNCTMFEILVEYKVNKESCLAMYPMLDSSTLNTRVEFAENLLDTNIEELVNCYDDTFEQIECTAYTKPLFQVVQDDNTSFPKNNYKNICGLWVPYALGIPYGTLTKDLLKNKLTKLIDSPISDNNNPCTIFERYPLIEQLSRYEIKYLTSKLTNDTQSIYSLFKPTICNKQFTEPESFYIKTRRKYQTSPIISLSSGHTILILLISQYFRDINLVLVVLGLIIWMVPYNHSIYEIMSAFKMMGLFPEFNYKNKIDLNISLLLEKLSSMKGGTYKRYTRHIRRHKRKYNKSRKSLLKK